MTLYFWLGREAEDYVISGTMEYYMAHNNSPGDATDFIFSKETKLAFDGMMELGEPFDSALECG